MAMARIAANSRQFRTATPDPCRASARPLMTLTLAALLCMGANTCAADEAVSTKNSTQVTNTDPNLTPLVRSILQNEVRAQAESKSQWCYRKLVEKDAKRQLYASCQSQGEEIDRLMAENGKPLTQKQWQQEDERIRKLLASPYQLRKQKQQQMDDARQATNMLKMIPSAFLFQQQSRDAERITLKFFPDPQFHPSNSSEAVFHHMEGTLTLDLQQQRLVEISGQLTSEVKFGGGFLGHLDKGGTFSVRQEQVKPGRWEMTKMDVQMNGKALFFKTIAVRTYELDTDFHPVPAAASIQQIAALTNEATQQNLNHSER
jgi:hypothetical protein